MNDNIYNREETQSYLLGSLPETETVRYDELSVVDDDFNDFLRNVENDLVDSYVNGQLDPVVLKQFESFYLATPKRREKVAFAKTFYQYPDRDPTGEAPSQILQTVPSDVGFWERLRFALNPAWLSFAAIALVCLIGAIWFVSTSGVGTRNPGIAKQEPSNIVNASNGPVVATLSPTTQPLPSPQETNIPTNNLRVESKPANQPEIAKTPTPQPRVAPVVATFVLSPPLRGASSEKSIAIGPNVERATFRLELEPVDYKSYKIELRDRADNKVVWGANNLKLTGTTQKSLAATVPTKLLSSRTYIFSVSGIPESGPGEIIGDYPFKVVR
jgi:hypothetical protein